jgi:hypothetical protein
MPGYEDGHHKSSILSHNERHLGQSEGAVHCASGALITGDREPPVYPSTACRGGGYAHRQNIQNLGQECEHAEEELLRYLLRKRNVDAAVVEAVTDVVRQHPLADASQICQEVSSRLKRTDLTPANIRAALDEVPCTVIRPTLQHQWEEGAFHPKEEQILQEALAVFLASPTPSLVRTEMT